MAKESRVSMAFVFLMLMAVVFAFLSGVNIPPIRLAFYAIALLFEIYAIANKTVGDTISEQFWILARRPFCPWICGILTTYYVMNGAIVDIREIVSLYGLQVHFFWQTQTVYEEPLD